MVGEGWGGVWQRGRVLDVGVRQSGGWGLRRKRKGGFDGGVRKGRMRKEMMGLGKVRLHLCSGYQCDGTKAEGLSLVEVAQGFLIGLV
jgi:hypothetical protein